MGVNRREKEPLGILDKFHIQVSDIRDYQIIGIDPGAGEWSASGVELLGNTIDRVKDLYVLNDGRTCKDSSVLYYSKDAENWEIGERAGKLADNEEAKRGFYENFKVLPGSPYAQECYGGNFENPTMEDLMRQNFQCIVKRLFVDGGNNLRGKKCIFFVGRPASLDWEKAELSYCDILHQALQTQGMEKEEIQIAMVSEAQASLAAEIYGRGLDLKSGRCQVVIDVGSSTVDAIVVKDGKVIGEYSRQIGAGCIEENMLELWMYDDCSQDGAERSRLEQYFSQDGQYRQIVSARKRLREKLREVPYISGDYFEEFKFSKISKFYKLLDIPPALLRFELRVHKENYFGQNGSGGTKGNGQWISIEGEGDFLGINNKTMENAIYRMPVFVPCTEYGERDNPYKQACIYRSYYEALAHFIKGVKEMHLKDEPLPDVIITGGAGVMPFVGGLIRGELGVEPENSTQPSYTVSRGLAYIGYAEIKKREELTAINRIISKVFAENAGNLSYQIKASFSRWIVDQRMETLRKWKDFGYGTSLDEAINQTYHYKSKDIGEMELVENWWEERIKPKIVKEVQNRFKELYKKEEVSYDFTVHEQIVENAYRESRTTNVNFDWSSALGGWTALWTNTGKTDYTSEKREKFFQKAQEHYEEMQVNVRKQKSVCELAQIHVDEIIDGFKEELCQDVSAYVEGLTPYIVRQ